jgi:hypothetical protein
MESNYAKGLGILILIWGVFTLVQNGFLHNDAMERFDELKTKVFALETSIRSNKCY